jgi:hypothetical protein
MYLILNRTEIALFESTNIKHLNGSNERKIYTGNFICFNLYINNKFVTHNDRLVTVYDKYSKIPQPAAFNYVQCTLALVGEDRVLFV